jgi:predicted metalloprotease
MWKLDCIQFGPEANMRWTPGGISPDIEDRRASSGGGGFGFGGGGARLGLGGFLFLLVLSVIFHKDFFALIGGGSTTPQATGSSDRAIEQQQPVVQFVSFVLDDVQNTWRKIFPSIGGTYHDAKLVLFREGIQSGCGFAQAESGPFYCPEDQKAYIDLSFFDELRQRFRAPGEFAEAYVLAHEIGHHVQHQLGIDRQLQGSGRTNANSVKLELQADCFAGIWGHSTEQRNILEAGELNEALNAASQIGDDRLQRMSGRGVNPDTFTHGSSAQRVGWFKRGFDSGDVKACDTFAGATP